MADLARLHNVVFFVVLNCVLMSAFFPPLVWESRAPTVPRRVAAFYYGWYGNDTDYTDPGFSEGPITDPAGAQWRHWNMASRGWYPPANACSTNTPRLGWYDSADPATIETHLRQAEWARLDALICSYWGIGAMTDVNFQNLLRVARAIDSNLTFSLYFEIHMRGLSDLAEAAAADVLVEEFQHLHALVTDPAAAPWIWTEDGKPVLFVYVSRTVSAGTWDAALTRLHADGVDFYIVADRPGGSLAYNRHFQGAHQYDVYAPTRDGEYESTFLEIRTNARKFGQVFAAGVGPGYDDRVVRDGNPPLDRAGGETYAASWDRALALDPDWVTITSWNEWHEGSEIEPSVEHDDQALAQTRAYVAQFKASPARFYYAWPVPGIVSVGLAWVAFLVGTRVTLRWDSPGETRRRPLFRGLGIFTALVGWAGIGATIYFEFLGGGASYEVVGSAYAFLAPVLVVLNRLFRKNI